MTTFNDLGLNSKIMKSLDELGFIEPSAIQEQAIPFILEHKNDLIALAQTGTGKTAAFSLPILNKIKGKGLQAIILCPTRELCLQISQDIKKFAKHSKDISVTSVYGGENISLQIRALNKGTNIVVGTPGRVRDLINRNVLKLQYIKWVVLDEADEMLDMGFKDDLDAILDETPETRQTLLFSATISKSVRAVARRYMYDAQEIRIGEVNVGTKNVSHEYYVVGPKDRFEALKRILDSLPGVYGILFCRTRIETQVVADKLKQAGYDTEALHGEIAQNMRTKIMARFKKQQIKLLVATDVAARGIDVNNLSHVINYNLPDGDESYTHRSGRTGRAQQSGVSISILCRGDVKRIHRLEKSIGQQFEYKQVPSLSDVYQNQLDTYVDEVVSLDADSIEGQGYLSEVVTKLKKVNKDDLIKKFVAHKYPHLIDGYKNDYDLNIELKPHVNRGGGSGENVNLKVNLGRNHRFDIKGLFALINSNKQSKGIEIGKINLLSEYSIFSVDKDDAAKVMKCLRGVNFRGNKVFLSETDACEFEPDLDRSQSRKKFNKGGGRKNFKNRGFKRKRY